MKEGIFWWRWVDRQPTEPINMGLGLPWAMSDGEVVLLQCCRPAVKGCRPSPHRLQPLEGIMVCKYLEWHSHEVRSELSHSPDNGQTLQFGGGIGLLSLVERPRSAADDTLFAIANLRQDRSEACGRRVGLQPKGLAKVQEGSDGTSREERLEAVEGGLAVGAPVENHIFLG